MSNAKANTKKFFMTPVVSLNNYCYINKPDMGNEDFPKPRGEYSVKCRIPAAQAAKLCEFLTSQHNANLEFYRTKMMPKQKQESAAKGKRFVEFKEGNLPFFEDAEGNVVFNFKMHGSYQDKKTGENKELVCRVYDAQGKRVFDVPNMAKDTEGRVEFSVIPYQSAVAGLGLKLQLSKFQLLKLVEWSSDNDSMDAMEGYEDGFVADGFGGGNDFDVPSQPTQQAAEPQEQQQEADSYDYDF